MTAPDAQSVLVLGGGGQLARELEPTFTRAGWRIEAVPRAACDIRDAAAVQALVAAQSPRVVINCAAYTQVDKAESEPEAAFAINATGAGNVARACAAVGVPLLHVSTDYVFDGAKNAPYDETDATNPMGVYARSKRAGEQEVLAAHSKASVVRTGELYGDGGRNFFHAIVGRARQKLPLKVIDDQRVAPTWTRELAAQLLAMVASSAPPGIYHATAEGETNWFDAAKAALDFLGLETEMSRTTTAAYGSPTPRPLYSVLAHGALIKLNLYCMRPWRVCLGEWLQSGTI